MTDLGKPVHTTVVDVLAAAPDELAGRVVVNLTGGTPAQARELAAWAAERGVEDIYGVIDLLTKENHDA